MKKWFILLVSLVSACVLAGDATYMRVNDAVVSQKEYQRYASFISHVIPSERRNDTTALKKEVENYMTELLLVKSAAKSMGKEIKEDQLQALLAHHAKQAGITVEQLVDNLNKEGIDANIYAEHQVFGQLLGSMIYDNYQSAFSIEAAQVESKKKALSHDQIDVSAVVVHENVLTKEEKLAMAEALKAQKTEGKVVFSQMGWQPVSAFTPVISEQLKTLNKGQNSQIIAYDGRNIMFKVNDKRHYIATDAEAKDVLFSEFLAEKRQKWLADKKKAARVVIY